MSLDNFTHKVGTLSSNALRAIGGAASLVNGAAALAAFFGSDSEDWDITEASYQAPMAGEAVIFHTFKKKIEGQNGALSQISDSGGRRKVRLVYPYRDGQSTDDLGRVAETFDLDVVIFGADYKTLMENLFTQLNVPAPGILMHPVRGKVRCALDRFQITHKSDERKAATIRITFIEHTFDATFSVFDTKSTLKLPSALSKLLAVFQKLDALANKLRATILFSRSIVNKVNQLVTDYKSQYADCAASINRVFNKEGQTDFPALLPVKEGGLAVSSGTASSTTQTTSNSGKVISDRFRTGISPDDPFAKVPVSLLDNTTTQALAAQQVIKAVNASRKSAETIIAALKQLSPTLSESTLASSSGLKLSANGDLIFSGVDDIGALEFQDDVLAIKQGVIDMQSALEIGMASSQSNLIKYTVPRLMSIREVAFANGVSVERVNDIDLLNPALLSVNFIEKGTVVLVPV